MSVEIHPTAIVSPKARISDGVRVGPYCLVEDFVEIGENTVLKSFVSIKSFVKIGEACTFFENVTLGGEPPPLLVPGENDADLVAKPGQGLVEGHARSARVGKHRVDPVIDESLYDDVGPAGRLRRAGGQDSRWFLHGRHGAFLQFKHGQKVNSPELAGAKSVSCRPDTVTSLLAPAGSSRSSLVYTPRGSGPR